MNFRASLFCIAGLMPIMITSCSGKVVRGSGPEKSEQRAVNSNGVTGLDISAPVDAYVYLDGQSSVILKGPGDALPYIRTRVKGNELVIDVPDGTDLNVSKNIRVEVHLPVLKSLDLSGAGKIRVESPFQTDKFDLDLSGAGTIVVTRLEAKMLDAELSGASDLQLESGKVEKAVYDLSGSGNIKATGLETRQAKVDISGAADAKVYVTESLEADISGAGSIHYKGRPKIQQDVSGSGKLVPIE